MSRRRRLHPPLLPGLWIFVALIFLLGSVGGYFYLLARLTKFEHKAPEKTA